MNSLTSEYELSQYRELICLDNSGQVSMVKDIRDNGIWVKKNIAPAAAAVYEKIKGSETRYIPYVKDVLYLDEKCYVIEEYIDGVDLATLIEQEGPMPLEKVREIMCLVCDALYFLHKRGIIHRDITPANIILKNNGSISLIDMGISRIKKEDSQRDTTILGTVGYAAPEQFGFKQTDSAADIYSCGVLINVLLTGKLPIEEKYIGEGDYIIDRCTQMDPADRYASASELKTALIRSGNVLGKAIEYTGRLPGLNGSGIERSVFTILYLVAAIFVSFALVALSIGDITTFRVIARSCILLVLIPILLAGNFMDYEARLPLSGSEVSRKFTGYFFAFMVFTIDLVICFRIG